MGNMKLSEIKKSKLNEGVRFVIYGQEGVGKSSLAADSESPIFLDVEGSTGALEVARYKWDGSHVPTRYGQIVSALRDILEQEHDFRTLVIDSLDALQGLVWDEIVRRESGAKSQVNPKGGKLTSIESFGFGKGYRLAQDEFRLLRKRLDLIRAKRGMNIVLIDHCSVSTYRNPEGDDYDQFFLAIHPLAGGETLAWADVVGFCSFDVWTDEKAGKSETIGMSSDRRLMRFHKHAAYAAKTRFALPAEVDIDPDSPWHMLREFGYYQSRREPVHYRPDPDYGDNGQYD